MLTINHKTGPSTEEQFYILRIYPFFRDWKCSDLMCLNLSAQVCFLNPLSMNSSACYGLFESREESSTQSEENMKR